MFFVPIVSAIFFTLLSFSSFFFFRTIVSSALSSPSALPSSSSSAPFFALRSLRRLRSDVLSPSLLLPLCTFRASLREPIVPIAALLCPLRRDLIPTKTPSNSPFRPKNLIILTFSSPKICIYHFFVLSLHQISGRPLIH